MTINEGAPVVVASEIEVAADRELVWDVLTAIDRWPSWNPDVKSVAMSGEVAEGSEFRWKAGPGTIASTIQSLERPQLVAWTGKTFGLNAIHVWRLEPRDGSTLVRTEESLEGLVARLFRDRLRKMLKSSLDAGLRHLKAEAERKSPTRA
jgi:uncharacterized protein YndB with AHSA1/START domain